MDTNTRIEALERAVVGIASDLAFALRHLERLAKAADIDDVRQSDQYRIGQIAEKLDRVAESLRP